MNANEIAPKASVRLQRIQTVSRIVRYLFLGLFAFAIGQILLFFVFARSFGNILYNLPFEAMLCFWYWKLAQLFRCYQQGLIFAPITIRCIKTLGILCALYSVVGSFYSVLEHVSLPSSSPVQLSGITIKHVASSLRMGFFSFTYAGFNLGMLLAGVVIILIAWIMDEGRNIQEEQELTV